MRIAPEEGAGSGEQPETRDRDGGQGDPTSS